MDDSVGMVTSIRQRPLPPPPAEGGWGWVVCMTVALCYGIVWGWGNTLPILHVALMKEFGKGNEETSWVGALVLVSALFFCSVGGILSDRFGIRQVGVAGGVLAFVGTFSSVFVIHFKWLYLTLGLLLGIGFSFLGSICPVILGHYFKKRLGLVNGLMAVSSGISGVIYAQLLPILIDKLGLRKTLLCFSAVHVLLIFYPLTWIPVYHRTEDLDPPTPTNRSHNNQVTDNQESYSEQQPILYEQGTRRTGLLNRRIWRNRPFVLLNIANVIAQLGYFVVFFHIVKYSEDLFPGENADLLNLVCSVSLGCSRLLLGLVADRPIVRHHYIHIQQAILFILGISTACLSLARHYAHLVVTSVLVGCCDGIYCMLGPPIIVSLLGVADSSQGMGFYLSFCSIPHVLGIVLAAAMYDYYGSYNLAFQVLSIPVLIGAAMMFLIDLL